MKRLYNAICTWLEADAQAKTETQEPQPEGNNFSHVETAHQYTSQPEMHSAYSRQSLDDDDGGVYKISQPISLRWRSPDA